MSESAILSAGSDLGNLLPSIWGSFKPRAPHAPVGACGARGVFGEVGGFIAAPVLEEGRHVGGVDGRPWHDLRGGWRWGDPSRLAHCNLRAQTVGVIQSPQGWRARECGPGQLDKKTCSLVRDLALARVLGGAIEAIVC